MAKQQKMYEERQYSVYTLCKKKTEQTSMLPVSPSTAYADYFGI